MTDPSTPTPQRVGHPNAFAAAVSAAVGTLAVWLAKRWFGYDLSPEYAGVIVGATSTLVLFVGRRGVKGLVQSVWTGAGNAWSGSTPKP